MPPTTTDIKASLFNTLYSTFDHNQIVIAYVAAAIVAASLLIRKPNRFHVLLLLGFTILAINFQYDKHIIEPLRAQTLQAVIPTPGTHTRAARVIDVLLTVLVPIGFFIIGWGLIFWAMIIGGERGKKNSTV